MACDTVELSRQNRKAGPTLFAMNKITQTMLYRQSLIRYAEKYGVTKAAIRYNTNRQYIYRWLKRYDGTLQSLADRSHRPHSHPNQHTEAELKLICNMHRRNPNNGLEFTNRLNSEGTKKQTLFEKTLCDLEIQHKLIKPFTPQHNGKVEHSHHKDNEEFYDLHSFYSFQDSNRS